MGPKAVYIENVSPSIHFIKRRVRIRPLEIINSDDTTAYRLNNLHISPKHITPELGHLCFVCPKRLVNLAYEDFVKMTMNFKPNRMYSENRQVSLVDTLAKGECRFFGKNDISLSIISLLREVGKCPLRGDQWELWKTRKYPPNRWPKTGKYYANLRTISSYLANLLFG